jgi:hypothetical protein
MQQRHSFEGFPRIAHIDILEEQIKEQIEILMPIEEVYI